MTDLPSLKNDLFLRACFGEPVERTPVWIMRQAGRYLPEYREIRAKTDFLTSCRTPEIACEITLQPVRRLGVDAAILFSDILVPLPGMGVPVAFDPGPVFAEPVRSRAGAARLRVPDAREATPFVMDAVRLIRRGLEGAVPLIGFAGAPFTVATYLVEGGGSKSFAAIKSLLYADPETAHLLLGKCADTLASYLSEQVRAGAQAAMLFDTWAGILSPEDYRRFALPYAQRVFEAVGRVAARASGGPEDPSGRVPGGPSWPGDATAAARPAAGREDPSGHSPPRGAAASGAAAATPAPPPQRPAVPRIYYAGEAAGYLEATAELGAEVVGLDWRLGLAAARRRLGGAKLALQGNLDPCVLFGPESLIEERARDVLVQAGPLGHIFNLGHGILPETSPDRARFLVDAVARLSSRE